MLLVTYVLVLSQVFSDPEETGIPEVQRYVHDLTHMHKVTAMKRLLRKLGLLLARLMIVLQDEGTQVCAEF